MKGSEHIVAQSMFSVSAVCAQVNHSCSSAQAAFDAKLEAYFIESWRGARAVTLKPSGEHFATECSKCSEAESYCETRT